MLDPKILGSTFVTVFLAELGDKTQLATFGVAGASTSKLSVFLGASLALIATSALAVLAGDLVVRWVSPLTIQRLAGASFVVLGLWMISGRAGG